LCDNGSSSGHSYAYSPSVWKRPNAAFIGSANGSGLEFNLRGER
jgi:hypothetical protein